MTLTLQQKINITLYLGRLFPENLDWNYVMEVVEKIRKEPGLQVILDGDITIIRKIRSHSIQKKGFKTIEVLEIDSMTSALTAIVLFIDWKNNSTKKLETI